MNKGILITGASSDLGCELIRSIGDKYDYIYAHFNSSKERVEALAESVKAKIIPLQADFAQETSVQKMLDIIFTHECLPSHIVFLAAPVAYNKRFHKCSWDDFEAGINISLRTEIQILQRLIKHIDGGKIVFMLTSYTIGTPPKFQSPYIVAKYAQLGLVKCLAAEYSTKGICINAVSPDMINTRFLAGIPEPIIEQNAERMPNGRNLDVKEVIPSIVFLLSEAANAISGQNIGLTRGGGIKSLT